MTVPEPVLASGPVLVFRLVPAEPRSSYVSASVTAVLGYTTAEVQRLDVVTILPRLLHPEDRARVLALALEMLEQRAESWRCEGRVRAKDGLYHWLDIFFEARYEAGGVLAELNGFALDISERKQAAAQYEHSVNAILRALDCLNAAAEPEDVLRALAETAVEAAAVRRVDIVTWDGSELIDRFRIVDGVWEETNLRLPLHASISGWVVQHRQPYRTEDASAGPLYVPYAGASPGQAVLAVPILTEDGKTLGVLGLVERRDGLTFSDGDQQLAEAMAHRAAIALQRARAAEERAQLSGIVLTARGVAHTMNQDLTVVVGWIELLEQRQPQLTAQIEPVRLAALRLAEKIQCLWRTWRIVTHDVPGVGPVLNLDASSDRRSMLSRPLPAGHEERRKAMC